MTAWVLGLSLAWATPEVPRWKWEQAHTWLISTRIRAEDVFRVEDRRNTEARLVGLQIHLLTTCTPVDVWRESRWAELRCDIDEISLKGDWFRGDSVDAAEEILIEWTEILEGHAWMQLVMRDDGRLVSMSLEGVENEQWKMSAIHTSMHMWLARAYAGFDLTLPQPDTEGESGWLDLHLSRPYQFPRLDGSFGIAETVHLWRPSSREGLRLIWSRGRALVERRGSAQYRTILDGTAFFDPQRGVLTDRTYVIFSEPTSGHLGAQGMYFNAGQELHMRLIGPETPAPSLPESGLRSSPQ